jgi:hypothetical protein
MVSELPALTLSSQVLWVQRGVCIHYSVRDIKCASFSFMIVIVIVIGTLRTTANAPGPSVHLGVHIVTSNPHA